MKTRILIISFLFFFNPPQKRLPVAAATTETSCSDTVCHSKGPPIRFPFQIEGNQPDSCGYPGFQVSCNDQGQTLLNLPQSGGRGQFSQFTIQSINYPTQQLWLNDPQNCLPKRILSLDLSESLFDAVYSQNFTFFNCSSNLEYLNHRYTPITCLADSNHTVFATSSHTAFAHLSSVCDAVKTVTVPVSSPFYDHVASSELRDDLRLSWDSPPCGRCESRGGRCGFESNSSLQVSCTNDVPSKGISQGARYAIAICLGVPALLCFIGLLSCMCSRFKILTHGWAWDRRPVPDFEPLLSPGPGTTILGLDGPTIESYPKMVIGENRNLPKPNDNTCPICLSDYEPKETVKSIPECLHYFHAQCIDEWLPLNAACPVCRTSPRKLPTAA